MLAEAELSLMLYTQEGELNITFIMVDSGQSVTFSE